MTPVEVLNKIAQNVEKVIIGKKNIIDLVLVALISKGHILIEDVPGVGKTSLVSAFARSIDCSFNRIQFTPDVMPSDVVGFSVYNRKINDFEFRKGAVFCQFLLADEINRTSSKTQASLLEAMEERQVTVDAATYELPTPFMVFATQNPIDYVGTFPLPEAQLDRFFMKIEVGYPSHDEEMNILRLHQSAAPIQQLSPIVSPEVIVTIQDWVQEVYMDKRIGDYIVSIVEKTREDENLLLGASPRASISLAKAARAYAYLKGRDYVLPDDVQRMAPYVLKHRLVLKQEAKFQNITPADVVKYTLEGVSLGNI